jgi:creatinine amidohydrolase
VDPKFLPSWRESKFPGGCAHACELETSLYLYLAEEDVRKDKIKNGTIKMNEDDSPFNWVDLFGAGPATIISWTSSYSETGVLGEPEKATKEKGERAYNEAVKQLCRFVEYFQNRPRDTRHVEQQPPPTMPLPWNQRGIE